MQSGISASTELQTAFQSLLTSPSQRGLLVSISTSPEALVPAEEIQSKSQNFKEDLDQLGSVLKNDVAVYVLLKQKDTSTSSGAGSSAQASGSCVAITYVPDAAPVRQKMLFASTRLTLVRELGTEHFALTLFATSKDELTPAGWAAHEASGAVSVPLTEEEQSLEGIKEAEAQESRGTTARSGGHVSSRLSVPIADDALAALKELASGGLAIVQLSIDIATENIMLHSSTPGPIDPDSLKSYIPTSAPLFTFFTAPSAAPPQAIFIYTFPATSASVPMKQRMLYASSRRVVSDTIATQVGLEVSKKIEADGPDDAVEEVLEALKAGAAGGLPISGGDSAPGSGTATPTGGAGTLGGERRAFDRPKRPGRR